MNEKYFLHHDDRLEEYATKKRAEARLNILLAFGWPVQDYMLIKGKKLEIALNAKVVNLEE